LGNVKVPSDWRVVNAAFAAIVYKRDCTRMILKMNVTTLHTMGQILLLIVTEKISNYNFRNVNIN
jgi:hypothetical protein